MRLRGIVVFVALCAFSAYYIYEPIPDAVEEKWSLMFLCCGFKTLSHVAYLSEFFGLKDYMDVLFVVTYLERIVPVSDENVTVTMEKFDGVEVLLYQPKKQGADAELRRAVIYLHGGGWCVGSSRMASYDVLNRMMATELDAVILSVEYRLAPAHHFPIPYEDAYRATKYFLQEGVLAQYSVDPGRVAVSGDSAGGNLAAAVSQQLQKEPGQQIQLKAQALIYPALQALDLNTPSYQQNQYITSILPRALMLRFWSQYFSSNKALFEAMMANTHNNLETSSLLKFVNWSAFLPEKFHKNYNYSAPAVVELVGEEAVGMDSPSQSFADPRASPLLVPDSVLRSLPKAYIITCEYDVLRDDGIMYATRLRAAGVEVTHDHYDEGVHGAIMFNIWPADFRIARLMTAKYIKWLKENL
ncbi:arylacetamide deacetylase isoform X1 [Solea solea]|uniref:arylacetamide deacetylase isoform X1 n=2 Tax=Solea solea TaxID=90069 RepID=UPI00272B1B19|nr:arylacetamide deacetylase isoform X1 [Solea solea]